VVTIPMATSVATSGRFGELTHVGKLPLARCVGGGSKQTRTADPLLVSYRRRVRCRTPVSGNPYP
jgi:hypothetical protein